MRTYFKRDVVKKKNSQVVFHEGLGEIDYEIRPKS